MGRGTGGPRAPIRVADDAGGEPSVAIADYQSEADEDAQARDREETKRLLYVALTRARDRLYLSATVKDGACRMGRGSLGEVLPASVRAMFVARVGRAVEDSAATRPAPVRVGARAARGLGYGGSVPPTVAAFASAFSRFSPTSTTERSGFPLPSRLTQAIQCGPRASLWI